MSEEKNVSAPAADKSKIAAGLLAIFLGWLGIHKFYLGYKKEGIILAAVTVVTCFCASGITSLIGIVEGILMLVKSDEEFKATYVDGNHPWF